MSQNKYVPELAVAEAPVIVTEGAATSLGTLALFGNLAGKIPTITEEQIRQALERPAWPPAHTVYKKSVA